LTPSNWYRDFMSGYGVEVGSHKPTKTKYTGPPPTLGHYRNRHGIRTFKVYCLNGTRCWHQAILTFDDLPDETIAKSLDARMVCTRCGLIGADVRPNWTQKDNR
jgi:hypothetical protein